MEKTQLTQLKIYLDIIVIILVLILAGAMIKIALIIKSEGGKCTASPNAYMEQKLKEQIGITYVCECNKKEFNLMQPLG